MRWILGDSNPNVVYPTCNWPKNPRPAENTIHNARIVTKSGGAKKKKVRGWCFLIHGLSEKIFPGSSQLTVSPALFTGFRGFRCSCWGKVFSSFAVAHVYLANWTRLGDYETLYDPGFGNFRLPEVRLMDIMNRTEDFQGDSTLFEWL